MRQFVTKAVRAQRLPSGYWENKENVLHFLSKIKIKYNFNTPEDWNSISKKLIESNGGSSLLSKYNYSIYELKCMACPEGKLIFTSPPQVSKYWENKENVINFLSYIKEKYNLNSAKDWNLITKKFIESNGGSSLFKKYSMFELKCLACPEGKLTFNNTPQPSGYWNVKENIDNFLSKIKEKYNLNTSDDWNLITTNHIESNGGSSLLKKYSMFEIKCMACPEGKSIFNSVACTPKRKMPYSNEKPSKSLEIKENIHTFLSKIKEKYNLNTPEDWNTITREQLISNGGRTFLKNFSMFEIKCIACPEGKSTFKNPSQATGYWEKQENIDKFLSKIKQKYNLNTPDDWNSITIAQIKSNGGSSLFTHYSIYELKCMACPEGKSSFTNQNQSPGYWEKQENIQNFLAEIKEKYNLNTPDDWNSITREYIQSNGGSSLLHKYSLYELKCMACPEGKSSFSNPKHSPGYWENKENILQFLSKIKQMYNINTIEDWNSITTTQIQANGGSSLLLKYSIYELKCMACPEGTFSFNSPPQRQSAGYWENQENIDNFLSKIKEKYNLNTPEDWKRISRHQITSEGGNGLLNSKIYPKIKIKFDNPNQTTNFVPFSKLVSRAMHKRASQRWLFLQIQQLFPHEEIVEDYFHSEISRQSGFTVQFDIFMIERNIAIEYHGKHHYEDIPSGFANVETYQNRDIEKEKICSEHGIQLIVIPYWWDNKLDSLRSFLYSKINL